MSIAALFHTHAALKSIGVVHERFVDIQVLGAQRRRRAAQGQLGAWETDGHRKKAKIETGMITRDAAAAHIVLRVKLIVNIPVFVLLGAGWLTGWRAGLPFLVHRCAVSHTCCT